MRVETVGNATLYLADSMDVLPVKADVVLTDPPYGMKLDASYANSTPNHKKGIGASKGYEDIIGDGKEFDASPFLSMLSHVDEQFWWGANYYREHLPAGGSWLVWDKRAGMPDFDYSLSEFELCWSRKKRHQRILRRRWFGLCGTETQDVRQRVHPSQKPIELMMDCLSMVPEAKIVVDPFMGSGSAGVAAVKMGRQFVGIEMHAPYFEIARERIENAQRQERLFA
jgi:DNA modification methylase